MSDPRLLSAALIAPLAVGLFSCCKNRVPAVSPTRPPDPAAIVEGALDRKSISAAEIAALVTWSDDETLPTLSKDFLNGRSGDELLAFMKLLIPHVGEGPIDHDNAWWILISVQGTCPPPDIKEWTDWIKGETPETISWTLP